MADHGKIIERCRRCEGMKSDMRQRWRESDECYNGNQWGVVYGSSVVEHERADPSQTRAVMNIYQAYANAAASMLTSGVILPQAAPLTDNPDEWAKAKAVSSLLSYIWNHPLFKVREAAETAALCAVLYGSGFLTVSWDPLLRGPSFRDPLTGQTIQFGFPRIDALTAYHVGWDMTSSLDEAHWAYTVSVVPVPVLKERFPGKTEGLEPDAGIGESPFGERLVGGRETTEKIGVMVFDYYEKPSEEHPKGLRAVITRDRVLYSENWPGDRIPIHHVKLYSQTSSPWGRTPFYDAIRVQRALNRTLSDILDNVSRMNAPSVLAPQGTMPQPLSFKPAARNEYTLKPGLPPPAIQHIPPLPQWAVSILEQQINAFERVIGLHGVVFGMAPFSRVSGRTFSMMLEQIARQYIMPATRLSTALIDVAWSVKELWSRFGPREISVKIAPDEPETLIRMDLVESGTYTLRLEPTDLMSLSKEAKLNNLKELVQMKIIDPQRFLELAADHGAHYAAADGKYLDRLWVRRQITKMTSGVAPLPPSDIVDPDVATRELADYMKRAEFEELPSMTQAAIMDYYQQFKAISAQNAAMAQAKQEGEQQPPAAGMGMPPGPAPLTNLPPSLAGGPSMRMVPPGVDTGEEATLQSLLGGA